MGQYKKSVRSYFALKIKKGKEENKPKGFSPLRTQRTPRKLQIENSLAPWGERTG
jgi:hypothetical protein